MSVVPANRANIEHAASLLQQGRLVAIPTETVYGLGADAKNPDAVKKIFAAKGRPADHPLIVHIADKAQLVEWAIDISETAWQLAERFWPGSLTLVLKKRPEVPLEVTGRQETVALRVPNHPVALELLKHFGGGIAAPSANRFCRISPTHASHVLEELGDSVDLILDGGACQVGLESAIVDLSGAKPRLLRPGQISRVDIEAVLQMALGVPEDQEQIHAPGRMEVHYAPKTTTLLCTAEQIINTLKGFTFRHNHKLGVIAYKSVFDSISNVSILTMPENVEDYGRDLYSSLRQLDNQDIDIILVEQPPKTERWQAVNNRLEKATKPFLEVGVSEKIGNGLDDNLLLYLISIIPW